MSKKRDWFKWKLRAGTRGTIRRTSRRTGNGFEVMGACVAMLDHARGSSHWVDNPEGVFSTTIEDIAHDYNTPPSRVREVLGALIATGWLQAAGDVAIVGDEDDINFRVVRYLEFNDPQGSPADRKAAQRDREMVEEKALALRFLLSSDIEAPVLDEIAELADLQGSVTTGHNPSAMSPEEKREEEREENTSDKAAPKSDLTGPLREVFDYWCEQTGSGRGRKPAFDQKRRARITARMREGFTAADLKACVDGFLLSPWHNGTESGRRYLGIETIFRDAAQVEKGMELAVGAANGAAAGVTPEQAALLKSLGGAA